MLLKALPTAFFAVIVPCAAVTESTQAPSAAALVIPPLEIPEETISGLFLRKIAFGREFDSPVTLATIPDGGGGSGEQVIAMQRGEFCAVRLEDGKWRPFLDFRERMKGLVLFEEGVHGIAFHPGFAVNRLFTSATRRTTHAAR